MSLIVSIVLLFKGENGNQSQGSIIKMLLANKLIGKTSFQLTSYKLEGVNMSNNGCVESIQDLKLNHDSVKCPVSALDLSGGELNVSAFHKLSARA